MSRDFEQMVNPPLADRLRAFEVLLKSEPCENKGHCMFLSRTDQMCAACRIALLFFHTVHNAEAYEGGPGKIPWPTPCELDPNDF